MSYGRYAIVLPSHPKGAIDKAWPVLDKANVTNSTSLFTWVDRIGNVSQLPFLSFDQTAACVWSWHKAGSRRGPKYRYLIWSDFLKGTRYEELAWLSDSRINRASYLPCDPYLPPISCPAIIAIFSFSFLLNVMLGNLFRIESGPGFVTFQPQCWNCRTTETRELSASSDWHPRFALVRVWAR